MAEKKTVKKTTNEDLLKQLEELKKLVQDKSLAPAYIPIYPYYPYSPPTGPYWPYTPQEPWRTYWTTSGGASTTGGE